MRQRQIQYHWFGDWTSHLETHTYLRAGWNSHSEAVLQQSGRGHTWERSNSPQDGHYAYQSVSIISRLSWGERKYDGYFLRRYAYSHKYPVLYMGLEAGHWKMTNDQSPITNAQAGLYAHLRVMLTQHANLGMGGTLTYALQAGAIFGRVPTSLLWQADANQGYAYDPYRFTLLHGNQLLADKYVALHTEWNGQGILFNLIPGIRWLHLRELVEAKLAYGYLSENHQSPISNLQSPHNLYAEVGIGLGNILRVADLYSVWSLAPEIQWAMRFRIHLGL